MIRRLALTAGFAVLGAVAFAPGASAQTAPPEVVPFTGTVGSVCTFTGTAPGTLVALGGSEAVAGDTGITGGATGAAGSTTVNCSGGGTLAVAQPTQVSVPAGFTPTIEQGLIEANGVLSSSIDPASAFDTGIWDEPQTPLTIPAATDVDVTVAMIAGTPSGPAIPSGTYEYNVTLTATPN